MCDLAVQYSANRFARRDILSATGKKWFSFFEPGGSPIAIHDYRTLGSGLSQAGIYPIQPVNDLAGSRRAVSDWLKQQGVVAEPGEYIFGYAYTKNRTASLNYQRAVQQIAAENPDKTYVIAVKRGFVLSERLGPNVRIVPVGSFSTALGIDLIAASDLAPLVTGDSSFATAALTTRRDRAFLYEMLPWKYEVKREITEALPDWLTKEEVEKLFSKTGLNTLYTDTQEIESFVSAFKDTELSRKVHGALRATRARTDLVGNTLKMRALLDHMGGNFPYLRFSREKNPFYDAFLNEWLIAKDGPDYIARTTRQLRRAQLPSEILTAGGLKMFAGVRLTEAELTKFLTALERLDVEQSGLRRTLVLESYAHFSPRIHYFSRSSPSPTIHRVRRFSSVQPSRSFGQICDHNRESILFRVSRKPSAMDAP